MFNEYPYVNLQDVNLDWILKHIKDLEINLQDFVKLNTIKYADPIIWNITKQYETNTVVIDGNTGTAYLSVQPVPTGVALTNDDYWTVIFTLNLTTSNQNITFRDDGTNVVATFASNTGDWILWNFYLYRVTQPISVNTAYVEGFNIERFSVELFIRDYINTLSNIIGDLDDLTTSDKTSIVKAINSLLTDINATIGDLDDLTTSDKTNIVEAINSLLTDINATIGDLDDLTTSDKTSVVNAINEVNGTLNDSLSYVTPQMFGAVADGITDDTAAIQAAINAHTRVYFPSGNYLITSSLTVRNDMELFGAGSSRWNYSTSPTTIVTSVNAFTLNTNRSVRIHDMNIQCTSCKALVLTNSSYSCSFKNIVVKGSHTVAFDIDSAWNYTFEQCIVEGGQTGFKINQGTSASFIDCLTYNCTGNGFDINNLTYTSFINCGSDGAAIGFYVKENNRGISMLSCGVEHATNGCFVFDGTNIACTLVAPNMGNHSTMSAYMIQVSSGATVTITDMKVSSAFLPAAPYGLLDNNAGSRLTLINPNYGSRPGNFGSATVLGEVLKAEGFYTNNGSTAILNNGDSVTLGHLYLNADYIVVASGSSNAAVGETAFISIANSFSSNNVVELQQSPITNFSVDSAGNLILTHNSTTARSYNYSYMRIR